jgi:hypothetical protein
MNAFEQGTLAEVQRMLDMGMEQLTPQQLSARLAPLGYEIKHSFNYINTSNENSYNAGSKDIIDIKTGHSFANIAADKTNLKELQSIRFNYFVFHRGRIWEF